MTVPWEDIEEAYTFFLGRRPDINNPPKFDTIEQMKNALIKSVEFRKSGRAKKYDHGWPLGQTFISRKASVIYCPIGKNACTFFKRQMVRLEKVRHEQYVLKDVHSLTDKVNTGIQLSDYPPEKVTRFLASPKFMRFAVIRDPAERLLSAYIEKFVINRLAPGNMFHATQLVRPQQQAQGHDIPDFDLGITFRAFIAQITAMPPADLDPHWRPQHLYLAGIDSVRLYSFGDLERLIGDLEERCGDVLPRQPQNVTGSGQGELRTGAADLLPAQIMALPRLAVASFMDSETRALIDAYFHEDYALFERINLQ